MADLKELFGDSDDSGPEDGASQREAGQKVDMKELFGSDSEDEAELAPPPPTKSRLKKGSDKPKKRKPSEDRPSDAPQKTKPRPKKRARPGGDDPRTGSAPEDVAANGRDAYDSGEDVAVNEEDRNFIASDDDLQDVAKEYEEERQEFADERDRGFDTGKEAPEEVEDSNPLMQAIKANRRTKAKDMDEKDKQHIAVSLIERMEMAWKNDRMSVEEQKPALEKLNMLTSVERILKQRTLHDTLLDYNVLEMVRNWLQPWPEADHLGRETHPFKRSLPNLTIRSALYDALGLLPIRPEHLRNSERDGPGLGKVILMLVKHPKETTANKRKLKALLEEWSRHIFKKTKDYRQLTDTMRTSSKYVARRTMISQQATQDVGDFVSGDQPEDLATDTIAARVQVPRVDGYHFKIRPEVQAVQPVNVGHKSAKKNDLINKMKAMQRAAVAKSQRGEKMSIEGRGSV